MNTEEFDLVAFRKRQDLSQTQLADLVGVSQATISRIETGESRPTLQLLSKIARALETPLREVVPREHLHELLGQDAMLTFYAFCPNPFCEKNKLSRRDSKNVVSWVSGELHPAESFDEVNYCSRCGTELLKECPSCGRHLEEAGTLFCISCGARISKRPTKEEWKRIAEILDSRAAKVDDEEVPF